MATRTWIDEHDVRRRAWRALVGTSTGVLAWMDEGLREATGLSLQEYDALIHTADADDGGIRMSELADSVLMTRAGLTSLVDRLEKQGLLQRVRDPDDRRAVRVQLTDEGWSQFRVAAALHLEHTSAVFLDSVDEEEATVMLSVLERVRGNLDRLRADG